jgi:hypothetical protein
MKKYLTLFLIVIMMDVFAVKAFASSLGVNVPPGYVLEVDSMFTSGGNYFAPAFFAGINENLALGVMYDTTFQYFTVTGRYVIVRNVAADVFYRFSGSGSWKADLRGKFFLNQNLALAGMVSYDSMDTGSFGALGQAEYLFSENWMGNVGINYSNSLTSLLLGLDYASENLAVGVNCIFPTTNFSNPMIEIVVDYLIKK